MGYKRSYLTVKQKKAVILLAEGYSPGEVADELGITLHSVRSWQKHNELFKQELDRRIEENTQINAEHRRKKMQSSLSALYREVSRRIANEELAELKDKDLFRVIVWIQNELRIDTPEDVTSKTEHRHRRLEDLQDRYKKSQSAKVFQKKKQIVTDSRRGRVAKNASENETSSEEEAAG